MSALTSSGANEGLNLRIDVTGSPFENVLFGAQPDCSSEEKEREMKRETTRREPSITTSYFTHLSRLSDSCQSIRPPTPSNQSASRLHLCEPPSSVQRVTSCGHLGNSRHT